VLESMGLVSSRRRVGTTVEPQERWNVYDPMQAIIEEAVEAMLGESATR
jgi:DNA-binding FadR family transcriptional regulator